MSLLNEIYHFFNVKCHFAYFHENSIFDEIYHYKTRNWRKMSLFSVLCSFRASDFYNCHYWNMILSDNLNHHRRVKIHEYSIVYFKNLNSGTTIIIDLMLCTNNSWTYYINMKRKWQWKINVLLYSQVSVSRWFVLFK